MITSVMSTATTTRREKSVVPGGGGAGPAGLGGGTVGLTDRGPSGRVGVGITAHFRSGTVVLPLRGSAKGNLLADPGTTAGRDRRGASLDRLGLFRRALAGSPPLGRAAGRGRGAT